MWSLSSRPEAHPRPACLSSGEETVDARKRLYEQPKSERFSEIVIPRQTQLRPGIRPGAQPPYCD